MARIFQRAKCRIMPVNWDHSHFAVSKHVMPRDYCQRLLAWPQRTQSSWIFHLRPFNSQPCQVPVADGRNRLTAGFRDYLKFVEVLFCLWLRCSRPRGQLWVCPEMELSHGYHVSTFPRP